MNRFAALGSCLLIVVCISVALKASEAAVETAEGDWVGGFDDGETWTAMQLHVRRAQDAGRAMVATLDLPAEFIMGRRLRGLTAQGRHVRFELPGRSPACVLDGEVTGPAITGTVRQGERDIPFRFARLANIDASRFAGVYRLGDGRTLHTRPWVELGLPHTLIFFDFDSGRFGALYASGERSFFCGPTVLITYPVDATVSFDLDPQGRSTGLTWNSGTRSIAGRRVALQEQEITFRNGDVELAGTLFLPDGDGPHPAIILVPCSSGRASREMARQFGEVFALDGVAALAYDKRGVGKSSGDWLNASFDGLAADALAAMNALKIRNDIDPRRIGMLGSSQSGWVVPLAASRSPDVAFIVCISGSGVTPEQNELYRVEHWLRADGFAEQDIRQATSFARRALECARTDSGWTEMAAFEKQTRGMPWRDYVGLSADAKDPFWEFWRLIRAYDPAPTLENVHCPVLELLGEKDTFVAVAARAEVWNESLERAGNKDFTIRLFPNAEHSLAESKTGGLKEIARLSRFVPGYIPLMRQWVRKHAQLTR